MLDKYALKVTGHGYYKKENFMAKYQRIRCYENWTLFVVEKGRFTFTLNSLTETAGVGDIIFFAPNQSYSREVIEPMKYHLFILEWRHRGSGEPAKDEQVLRDLAYPKLTISEHHRVVSTVEHLRKLYGAREPFGELDRLLAEHFIQDLVFVAFMEKQRKEEARRRSSDPLMEQARAYLELNACRDIQMAELAASYYLSVQQFRRRFQAAVGISPKKYLIAARMKKAQTMLESSEYTTEHIAEACGFENRSYFSRVFTEWARMTPSQYRKLYRSIKE